MDTTYELTYLIDPQLDETAREELNTRVEKEITSRAGAILQSTPTLRRKLAYPIDNKHSTFIRTIFAELDSESIPDFNTAVRKTEGVIRHSLLRTPIREGIKAEVLEEAKVKKKGKPTTARKPPKKDVTMEEVEEGIEKALTEEVK